METEIIISFGALIALTVALTEVVKRAGMPIRFVPAVSILAGTILGVLSAGQISIIAVLTGLIIGATASGLYDVGKQTIAGK